MSGRRIAGDGLIDRGRPIRFEVDGVARTGFSGDTLASALLGAGVTLMGRSFKYHRPRGVLSAGVEEPSALFAVGVDGRMEPDTRATDVFLYEGLTAASQNRWPSRAFDVGAANQAIAPFIPAGFYYKTFFGGPRLWKLYERFIRAAAGLGPAPSAPDPDAFEQRAAFCDVLVVGAGPAGLAAALAAARAGARVILAEQDVALGGGLLRDPAPIDGLAPDAFAAGVREAVSASGGRVLTRAGVAAIWDHGMAAVAQRLAEPGQAPGPDGLCQRLWQVRARRIVLAAGAIERPLPFSGNDRRGVMLSGAVRAYLRRWRVAPGTRAVIATCNDDASRTAEALAQAGVQVAATLDARRGERLVAAHGGRAVRGVTADLAGRQARFDCDLVAVSGGFTPAVQLHMQAGGALSFDETLGAFVPGEARNVQASAGACAGRMGLAAALADGWSAGLAAAAACGARAAAGPAPRTEAPEVSLAGAAYLPAPGVRRKTAFVDLQNDVTLADLDLAQDEGFAAVEHLKRYTTLGMATDQGKTSSLLGLAQLAHAQGRPLAELRPTTFRPPWTPLTLGALAGEAAGAHAAPWRRMPLAQAHTAAGAAWQPSGLWSRPRAFPLPGESLGEAALREARAVRTRIGVTDVSTLAKFEVAGPDAAALLERVCATRIAHLKVGRGRYTFMLREDGLVFDDGTVWRIGPQRFWLTSSTGGAERMAAHIAHVRRVLAPQLRCAVAEAQEAWAGAALAGPRAREALGALLGEPPPTHMSAGTGQLAGAPVRVMAASYSGERAFEVWARPADMPAVWAALSGAAIARGGAAYGLDALELLRIEKGHPEVGAEIDGRRTPGELGLAGMLNPRGGFVGWQGLTRPALHATDRAVLVGLTAAGAIPEGAMLIEQTGGAPVGHVTSAGRALLDDEGGVALGLLQGGAARAGENLIAASPTRGRSVRVTVTSPHHYDPEGTRYRD